MRRTVSRCKNHRLGWSSSATFFPLKHFGDAFRDPFDRTLTGAQFHWDNLGYMALWGVVGVVLAVRFFKWEPSKGTGRKGRKKSVEPSATGH